MPSAPSVEPRPFAVDVPEEDLADLRRRLVSTRWPDEPPGAEPWAHGTDLSYLRSLVGYWRDGFDWRAQERVLNGFSQHTVAVAGIDLHFIHQPGVGPAPMPLLLSHGWPGSVWEFHELIPRLTDPARFGGDPADAFTVVAPSLPGYGFSYRPHQPRLGTDEIADVFAALMSDVLGYERFAAAGGDWGAFITARLAFVHPERLRGIHLTLLPYAGLPDVPAARSPAVLEWMARSRRWLDEERGYQAIQGTRPQTLAYGLTDSPVGLAAWIVEKFRAWSDCGGDLESRFSRDDLLTNVAIYWFTGAIGSSFWPYRAMRLGMWRLAEAIGRGERVEVPTAYADFPGEILRPPRALVELGFDLRRFSEMPSGGHFAALEEPELLARDVREAFRPFR